MQFKKGGWSQCNSCKGTGQQETEIYPLTYFEKCRKRGIKYLPHTELCGCKGTGYIIPKELEPYEIKKVSEINHEDWDLYIKLREHNLKEDDKVVIRRKRRSWK